MINHRFSKSVLGTFGSLVAALAGCGRPPELPPEDSMSFLEFKKGGDGQALVDAAGGSTKNVDLAALSVGLVSLGVHAALLTPRLTFAAALTAKAEQDGDWWVWDKTLPLAGWRAELKGRLADGLELEMRVTGLRGESTKIQNFLWYTGRHEDDHGVWTIYAPEVTGPVVTIDWTRASATDKNVTFTNVTSGPEGGDVIRYAIDGNLASMAVHDAKNDQGVSADLTVVWHLENGSGRLTKDSTNLCWDTLSKGQVDIECPAGGYPAP